MLFHHKFKIYLRFMVLCADFDVRLSGKSHKNFCRMKCTHGTSNKGKLENKLLYKLPTCFYDYIYFGLHSESKNIILNKNSNKITKCVFQCVCLHKQFKIIFLN